MKTDKKNVKRIVKNILLSLFIYALPIILMLFTFYLTGERPWQKLTVTTNSQSSK